jgi:hypothetical protein
MSATPEPALNFDKADFGDATSGPKCGACNTDLRISYFEVNGAAVCPNCRAHIAALDSPEGGAGRFVRAVVFGMAGGAVGAAAWYAVARLFNLEIGLIAILVGWLVGSGVHKGSQGRGGLKYQLLAAFLTYASIVTTYIPTIYNQLVQQAETPSTPGETPPAADGKPGAGGEPEGAATNAPPPATVAASSVPPATAPTSAAAALKGLVIAGAILYAIAFAAPFLMGFQNIIGILIIGFAVYQAWKMNGRRVLEIKGPFRVSATPTDPPVIDTQPSSDASNR